MPSLVFGFARWSGCSKATPYSTISPGMLIVFMRPPSLEPSTPEVSEPREGITRGLGDRLAARQRREDRRDRPLVAEPPGVENHVVVRRVVAVVPVDLLDVGGPVLVGLLQAAPRFVYGGDAEAGHDRFDPDSLRRPQKDVERGRELAQDVGAAASHDH